MLAISAILVFVLPIFTPQDSYAYSSTVAIYGIEITIYDMAIISSLQVSKYNKIPKTEETKSIKRRRIMWIVLLIVFVLLSIGSVSSSLTNVSHHRFS
jgi:hypothetical protein